MAKEEDDDLPNFSLALVDHEVFFHRNAMYYINK